MQKVEAPPPSRCPMRAITVVITVTPMTLLPTSFMSLPMDNVEHASVGHDTEIQHREHEQGGGWGGGVEAGLDHGLHPVQGDIPAQDQDHSQNEGEHDKGDAGEGLALEQGHHNGDDAQQSEKANYSFRHNMYLFPSFYIGAVCGHPQQRYSWKGLIL